MLEVFTSNPAYLEVMEGPAGYSLGQLARDWQVAQMSGRTMLCIRRRADLAVVGVAELLDSHPDDGCPWLGLLIIRRDQQRRGYASEALPVAVLVRAPSGWASGSEYFPKSWA